MIVGYLRNTADKREDARLLEELRKNKAEKIFVDAVSGKDTNRPQLQLMMEFIREGDMLVINEFSRISWNVLDLLELVEKLQDLKVDFKSLKEDLDTSSEAGKKMLPMFSILIQLEKEKNRERQREGIAAAKAKGKHFGRRVKEINEERFIELYNEWKSGYILQKKIMDEFNISRSTLNKHIKRMRCSGRII